MKLHRDYSDFLAEHFTGKVQKLAVDAGFTCPNRDGRKGVGGCIYCNNQAFNTSYCNPKLSVTEQLEAGKKFFAGKYPHMQYLAYFQAHTNTYAPIEKLILLYEEALDVEGVVGIVIATRPDCVSEELLKYLRDLQKKTFVMLEYGVESLDDDTLVSINRCHNAAIAIEMIKKTAEYGIPCGAHLILGLPGETEENMLQTVGDISKLPLSTIKFHQLQVIKGTRLAKEWECGSIKILNFTAERYAELCAKIIKQIPENIAIERFVSSSPSSLLLHPCWGLKPQEFSALLEKHVLKKY